MLLAHMEELTKKFRTQFWQKQYEEMEATWLELVEAGTSYEQLLELLQLTDRQVPRDSTATMLSLLADMLREQGRFADELEILRRQAVVAPDDAALARTIVACVQRVYPQVSDLEQLLRKAGLGYGQSLKEALPRLDRYLCFLPGTRVLDADRGPGRVKKLDLLLDKVTVDFDRGAELVWDLAAAQRILRVCRPDGYFVLLERDRAAVQEMAASQPGRVVAAFLADSGAPASVKEIQEGLARVVSRDAWEGFWNRARRELAKDPHIACRTVPSRTYQWTEAVAAGSEEPAARAARRPRRDVDAAQVAGLDAAGVQQAYAKLETFPERKQLLEALPRTHPDNWFELYQVLFLAGRDSRARAIIEKELAGNRGKQWQALLETVLTGYRQNTEAFLWLVEHFERLGVAGPKGIVTRILDLLESAGYKPYWSKFRSVLVDSDYRLVQAALEQIDEAEAGRMLGRVDRARILDGYFADEIRQLVVARYPNLDESTGDNVVYTTAPGLEKAKKELHQLTTVEIPRTADEIARARAHGDLSENYEYKAAKEKQGRLMTKVKRLRDEIARARPVAAPDVDTSEVSFGCHVRLDSGAGSVIEYSILGPWDADPEHGVISYLSPFAQLLLGRKPGDSIEMDGQPYRIAAIEPGLRA
jgi:transcription elongation factor GreA